MKFGVVNKSTILNRFVLHTLQRNTHLAVITRKTNIKLGILKGGNWKRAFLFFIGSFSFSPTSLKQEFYGLTKGFTRLIMRTIYACYGFISLHVNFHDNRTK